MGTAIINALYSLYGRDHNLKEYFIFSIWESIYVGKNYSNLLLQLLSLPFTVTNVRFSEKGKNQQVG